MHAYKHLYVLCVYIFIYIFMYTYEYIHTFANAFIHMNTCMYMLCILALSLARSRSLACSLALPGSDFYSHVCVQAPTHAQDTHFEETIEEKSATSTQKSGALPQTLRTPLSAGCKGSQWSMLQDTDTATAPTHAQKSPIYTPKSPAFCHAHAPHLEEE